MNWISTILASGIARKALGLMLAAVTHVAGDQRSISYMMVWVNSIKDGNAASTSCAGVTPVTISACGDGMMCGAMRQRRLMRSISAKLSSVRIAANWSGWSKAGDIPVVSRS
jgi:hypothetical protein